MTTLIVARHHRPGAAERGRWLQGVQRWVASVPMWSRQYRTVHTRLVSPERVQPAPPPAPA